MGVMDRDYMKDQGRQRPFSPPPGRSGTRTLLIVLTFIAALFALYKIADWKLNQRAAEIATRQAAAAKPIQRQIERPSHQFPQQPTHRNAPGAPAGTRIVTKCVVNGNTSYGDSSCAQGAITTQVTTRADHNLMVAVRPAPATQTVETNYQTPAVAQNNPPSDAAAKKAQCQLFDEEIKRLDSMSRQPQSAHSMDWIRERRKTIRDEQFRIPCQ